MLLGPTRFLIDVAHPLIVQVGDLWADGKLEVRHEHLLTECLSGHLRVLMSSYDERPGAPRVLLATLPKERHGLGLEMVQVYLAVNQVVPILVGVETPTEQIVKAARRHVVDVVGLLVTGASDLQATAKQLRWILAELPRRVGLWIGGSAGPDLTIRDDTLRIVTTWRDLDGAIATLTRRPRDEAR
jgi:cobalamin-dependent methionine synthase I